MNKAPATIERWSGAFLFLARSCDCDDTAATRYKYSFERQFGNARRPKAARIEA